MARSPIDGHYRDKALPGRGVKLLSPSTMAMSQILESSYSAKQAMEMTTALR
ncbi:hypothetical protein [Prochlorothrix hollandica]|uniref:hypothetical protein n=1 Tax=Prochlorothrix hollandica TaxID=1223 RepID=UPI0012B5C342|nr:hypothetical protein [Prochlorothrix hollandica]